MKMPMTADTELHQAERELHRAKELHEANRAAIVAEQSAAVPQHVTAARYAAMASAQRVDAAEARVHLLAQRKETA